MPGWLTATVEHEGYPLALRVRPEIDQPGNVESFPHLAVISHRLTRVRPDGMPEPAYHMTLSELDHDIHSQLESTERGRVMIVETFGGTRSYYACVATSEAQELWLSEIQRAHSEHSLSGEVVSNWAWQFYREYREEWKW